MDTYRAGIDIGSTTVKLAVLDDVGAPIFGRYERHHAHTRETLAQLLREAREVLGPCHLRAKVTGSGAIHLSEALDIPFVQEVVAVAGAIRANIPGTDVAIELGGEDAKILYLTGGLEERMNGVCAGGTGSFIDQMAALLQTDAQGLNDAARNYTHIYPIAARCGVFAKTDIQPLINEGVPLSDLAASIFQAVVNQTISGLACGKPIRGRVAFLGGPLHFLPELRRAFVRTLGLNSETGLEPQNAHLFAAIGAALDAAHSPVRDVDELIDLLEHGALTTYEMPRLPALFASQEEYDAFERRHARARLPKKDLQTYEGSCFLGVDAGSTTTKLALVSDQGELLFSFYANNRGNPVKTAVEGIRSLRAQMPKGATIARSCATGYGEALLKEAFQMDEGEVETIAHTTAAAFFDPQADCVLDIGGQDMKCIRLKNGAVDTILLNEACSSGCGSFIENFAQSLGLSAQDFAKEALFAKNPVDLGTRCTVFMNSNVKQAQKEGALVSDISAGLAYSVVKNALFKVIKLTNAGDLGTHIVAQGGTFYNHAVLRALERIAGTQVVCPDVSGLMGAFGAALIARDRYDGRPTSMPDLSELENLTYTTSSVRCGRCANNCMLTVNRFPGGRRFITGNRCERPLGGENRDNGADNLFVYKRKRMFDYEPLAPENAPRGEIGIPRVLNLYENYPFWAVFFRQLGFRVVLSPLSDRKLYERGMQSIPSESECYPAKLSHGHVQWLADQGIQTIFYPCVFYEHQETETAQNHYNCPMVISYAENLKNNVEAITEGQVRFIRPFIAFTSERTAADRLVRVCREIWQIPEKEVRAAVHLAWLEQRQAKADVRAEGARALARMRASGGRGIVVAGRPYHVDPEINHGIPEMIASYHLTVFTEDSLPLDENPPRPLRVVDQWAYHTRLYEAAQFVSQCDDLELIQFNSFGCGLDAVTTDQVAEILEKSNKLYTLLKIDEVHNLGAVRIRVRSLLAAMDMRRRQHIHAQPASPVYHQASFTKPMREAGYTILCPPMSPLHFDMLEDVFRHYGYNIVMLDNDNREAVDMGLRYVNNDACYPSIIVVGQFMQAILSGKYDTNRLAIIMTQTGGSCRASNYVGFIRRALDKANLSHIPVISLNLNGMETNDGFRLSPALLLAGGRALVYGDLFMRCLYRVRPYEQTAGSADALQRKWRDICVQSLTEPHAPSYEEVCRGIVADFDALPLNETVRRPRVGIVGEILVKYMPLANNHLVELLEREGAEAVVPDLMDFFCCGAFASQYRSRFLGTGKVDMVKSKTMLAAIDWVRRPAIRALRESRRFDAPESIEHLAQETHPFLSMGNQSGEGWFLAGEMLELIRSGVPNIVCIQPFACLPNHVVGKGVIKALRKAYPQANIAAVDYDPGASEVNQLNRIKLMLSIAQPGDPPDMGKTGMAQFAGT